MFSLTAWMKRARVTRPLPPGLTPLRLKSLSVVYALVPSRWAAKDVFSATAARMSAWSAFSSILSPSWKSMARLVLPSRLELKRPEAFRQVVAAGKRLALVADGAGALLPGRGHGFRESWNQLHWPGTMAQGRCPG